MLRNSHKRQTLTPKEGGLRDPISHQPHREHHPSQAHTVAGTRSSKESTWSFVLVYRSENKT